MQGLSSGLMHWQLIFLVQVQSVIMINMQTYQNTLFISVRQCVLQTRVMIQANTPAKIKANDL